jgi:hypothetical protein
MECIQSNPLIEKIVSLSKDYCISLGRNYAVMKNDLSIVSLDLFVEEDYKSELLAIAIKK